MVTLNKIYTRGGDAGETALGNGERVPKTAPRVEGYGTVDEANATIGLARLYADGKMDTALERISNDLFDLGADLCTPEADGGEDASSALRIVPSQVDRLEQEIDVMNKRLEPLKSFVLPGGSALAAHLHVARTVCRRAERMVIALAAAEAINGEAIRYLNRLSDWLFVAARIANLEAGGGDKLWTPGASR